MLPTVGLGATEDEVDDALMEDEDMEDDEEVPLLLRMQTPTSGESDANWQI